MSTVDRPHRWSSPKRCIFLRSQVTGNLFLLLKLRSSCLVQVLLAKATVLNLDYRAHDGIKQIAVLRHSASDQWFVKMLQPPVCITLEGPSA